METGASFEFVEGATSDLSFAARGPTLASVFQAAGEAFLAATVEEPDGVARRVRCRVVVDEPDLDLLLLRFLNELVYLRDAEELLLHPAEVEIGREESPRLAIELVGERIDRGRHALLAEIKAATVHGLRVSETPEGWAATATLDV